MNEVRLSWCDDRDETRLRHGVTLKGVIRHAGGWLVDGEHVTDCGIELPLPTTCQTDEPITCDACLFGDVDGLLREFAKEQEPVAA